MKIINVTGDGLFIFTASPSSPKGVPSKEIASTVYFSGDAAGGTITLGIINDVGEFLPFEGGTVDVNTFFRHGIGAILAVNVVAYAGTLTRVYIAG